VTNFGLFYQWCRLEKYSPRLVLVHVWKHVHTHVLTCAFMHTQKIEISGIIHLHLKLIDLNLMNFPSFQNELAQRCVCNSKEGQFSVSLLSLSF